MSNTTIADHESGIADIGFLSGFIEVFQYEDGSLSMAMDNMTVQSVRHIIAALQAKLDMPDETVH